MVFIFPMVPCAIITEGILVSMYIIYLYMYIYDIYAGIIYPVNLMVYRILGSLFITDRKGCKSFIFFTWLLKLKFIAPAERTNHFNARACGAAIALDKFLGGRHFTGR
jgi:hypothetical protein